MTIDTKKLRNLANAATPGPWKHKPSRDDDAEWDDEVIANEGPIGYSPVCEGAHERDAAFIAAANPQTVLALLDEIERLRKVARKVGA